MSRKVPEQLRLPEMEGPRELTGMSLVEALIILARDRGGVVYSTEAREKLQYEGILPSGEKSDGLARKRLYRALSQYGRFIRLRHGVYQLNPAYKPATGLSDEQAHLLRRLRGYSSELTN